VEGHWKYIIIRPNLQDKGVETLKQIQLRCVTFLPSDVNQFHVNLTTLTISPKSSVRHLLRRFNTSKRQSEESGLTYTDDFTVDLLIIIINKAKNPKYSVKTNIYMDKNGNKRKIVDFTAMESAYLNLDKNRLINEQAKFTQTEISSHVNFYMPSNKLNKVPSNKKRAQKPSGKATQPRDSNDSPCKCYSYNYLDHLLTDCPTHEKYLKERKSKKEAQQKSYKIEYVSMANVINLSPIKTSLEEEELRIHSLINYHLYISTYSANTKLT
jgi:hypothetical protein